ncbi:neuropeptide CCHamide-2 isoform X3 [Eurosta solidaginis]|uniref:neuropeptide CCHamide-2 isoform X3 n=1 Tax=Eurosta solidaginis TaxID=178769 RepID=UPI0035310F64
MRHMCTEKLRKIKNSCSGVDVGKIENEQCVVCIKEGCNAYGHACYGGHGKRSLGSLADEMRMNNLLRNEREEMHADKLMQLMSNEATGLLPEGGIETLPRYRLVKYMRALLSGHLKRPIERRSEIDYPISSEAFNRENNNNAFK